MLGEAHIAIRLLLTLAIGAAFAVLFKRLKVPAGYMVGAFVGVAILNCTTSGAWLPDNTRLAVQVVAGAFVGCSLERSDIRRLRYIGGPVAVMLGACLALMILAGLCIFALSPFDLVTSLMCAVPGGINDIPIVAADMGADAPVVAILQLVRQILGIAILPAIIAAFDRLRENRGHPDTRSGDAIVGASGRVKSKQKSAASTVAALAVALAGGLIGRATHIPGMTFCFVIVAVTVLKLGFDFAYIPKWLKKVIQVVAGCYIGTLLTLDGLLGMEALVVPVLIVVAFYTANCFATGWLEQRLFGYGRKEGMLIASPAGASDMILIMDDMGVKNTDVMIMQVIRASVVMAVFPQIVNLVCYVSQAI